MAKKAPNIYSFIGNRIRELRVALNGKGISQGDLASAMKTTANTISRWETATYKPTVSDLEKLAHFFEVPITAFFPDLQPSSRLSALVNATGGLDEEDLEEVVAYALFRRARQPRRKR